jgi:hypothetical protein
LCHIYIYIFVIHTQQDATHRNNHCYLHRVNKRHFNSRDIMCHTVTQEYQHLEFRSRTLCVHGQQIEERFEATRGAQAVEEQPQVVQDLVLITQACKQRKQNNQLLNNTANSSDRQQTIQKQTPWSESASKLYRPRDRRLSAM